MTWLKLGKITDHSDDSQSAAMSAAEKRCTFCPLCREKGKDVKLRMFQINFKEAVWLCSEPKCTYPMGVQPSQSLIVNRDVSEATFSKKRKVAANAISGTQKKMKVTVMTNPSAYANKPMAVLKNPQRYTSLSNNKVINNISTLPKSLPMPEKVSQTDSSASKASNVPVLINGKVCYPQWKNQNKLCWLDAMLCLLVHSSQMNRNCSSANSQIIRLLKSYQKACQCYRSGVDGPALMRQTRNNVWHQLQPKLRCIAGKEDSAACGLMALLSTEPPEVQGMCDVTYDLCAECEHCGNKQQTELHKRVLVFPPLSSDFSMQRPAFYGTCSQCYTAGQRVTMEIKTFPAVVLGHFISGLPGTSLPQYDFHSPDGSTYRVTAVIQYRRSPDHFVTWIRNTQNGHWMECDDLGPSLCEFKPQAPRFPLNEVHIAMWEKEEPHSTTLETPPMMLADEPVQDAAKLNGNTFVEHKPNSVSALQQHAQKAVIQSKTLSVRIPPNPVRINQVPIAHLKNGKAQLQAKNALQSNGVVVNKSAKQSTNQKNGFVHVNSSSSCFINITKAESIDSMAGSKSAMFSSKMGTSQSNAQQRSISRMREKFLQDKKIKVFASKQQSVSNSAPSSSEVASKRKEVSLKPSVVQSSNVSRTSDVLQTSMKLTEETKSSSTNTTLDRVLKYLPKSNSLPFTLSALDKAPPKTKSYTSSSKQTFSGYVPKAATSEIQNNGEETKLVKKGISPNDSKKKNVKFVLDDKAVTSATKSVPSTTKNGKKPGKSSLVNTSSSQSNICVSISPKTLEALKQMSPKKIAKAPENPSAGSKMFITSPEYVMRKKREEKRVSIPGISPIQSTRMNKNHVVEGASGTYTRNGPLNGHPSPVVQNGMFSEVISSNGHQNASSFHTGTTNGTPVHIRNVNGTPIQQSLHSQKTSYISQDMSQDQRVPDACQVSMNNTNSLVLPDFLETNIAKHNLLEMNSMLLSNNDHLNLFSPLDLSVRTPNRTATQVMGTPNHHIPTPNRQVFSTPSKIPPNGAHPNSSNFLLTPPGIYPPQMSQQSPFNNPLCTSSPMQTPGLQSPEGFLKTPPSLPFLAL